MGRRWSIAGRSISSLLAWFSEKERKSEVKGHVVHKDSNQILQTDGTDKKKTKKKSRKKSSKLGCDLGAKC